MSNSTAHLTSDLPSESHKTACGVAHHADHAATVAGCHDFKGGSGGAAPCRPAAGSAVSAYVGGFVRIR
jgi:hypothetical protein